MKTKESAIKKSIKYFVFIVGSFEVPEYIDFVHLRKIQLEKYNIPYAFLFCGHPPSDFEVDPEHDFFFPKDTPEMNPRMFLKFYHALESIDEDSYDFIVRLNLSTFINFPLLNKKLEELPKKGVFAGDCTNETPDIGMMGTCMIFSPDVIKLLKSVDIYNDSSMNNENDDFYISKILRYNNIKPINIPQAWVDQPSYNGKFVDFMAVRCKQNNRSDDVKVWKYLMAKIDKISSEYETFISKHYSRSSPVPNNNRKIPYIFFQTASTNIVYKKIADEIKKVLNRNPHYEYFFFTDEDARIFLLNHFSDEIVKTFVNLIPGAYKADFFRYCFLYIYGGLYIDINKEIYQDFDEIIDQDYDFMSCIDRFNFTGGKFGIWQAIIACPPGLLILKLAIEKIIDNVKNNFYGFSCLEPTGPLLLGKTFLTVYGFQPYYANIYKIENSLIKFLKLKDDGNSYDSFDRSITVSNLETKKAQNDLWKASTTKEHYGKLWSSKNIYYNHTRSRSVQSRSVKIFLLFMFLTLLTILLIIFLSSK